MALIFMFTEEEERKIDVFSGGCHLENSTKKGNSDHFSLLASFFQVASSVAFAIFYHVVW